MMGVPDQGAKKVIEMTNGSSYEIIHDHRVLSSPGKWCPTALEVIQMS